MAAHLSSSSFRVPTVFRAVRTTASVSAFPSASRAQVPTGNAAALQSSNCSRFLTANEKTLQGPTRKMRLPVLQADADRHRKFRATRSNHRSPLPPADPENEQGGPG